MDFVLLYFSNSVVVFLRVRSKQEAFHPGLSRSVLYALSGIAGRRVHSQKITFYERSDKFRRFAGWLPGRSDGRDNFMLPMKATQEGGRSLSQGRDHPSTCLERNRYQASFSIRRGKSFARSSFAKQIFRPYRCN